MTLDSQQPHKHAVIAGQRFRLYLRAGVVAAEDPPSHAGGGGTIGKIYGQEYNVTTYILPYGVLFRGGGRRKSAEGTKVTSIKGTKVTSINCTFA